MAESDDPRREELENMAKGLARALREALPDQVGFTLLLFDYGEDGKENWMTYISSAERAQMMKTMRETLERLQSRTI